MLAYCFRFAKPGLLAVIFILSAVSAQAQNLAKEIPLKAENKRLEDVLTEISTKGNFYFSYNSLIVNGDSLVSVTSLNKTVKEILDEVLAGKYEYRDFRNYIILRYAPKHLTIIPEKTKVDKGIFSITGYVVDEESQAKLKDVSVYQKILLQSTLTDRNGYFKIRVKNRLQVVPLTASKELYRDTTFTFLPDVKVNPENTYTAYDDTGEGEGNRVENTFLGRFFVSSRQKIQSVNISGFFAKSPFQASLTPGLSSHGMFSSQVVNKFSLNALGGYTAGVKGFEIAGLFNINKKDVKYVQVAGVFNTVGGQVSGVQIGGISNVVLKDVRGVQVGGISNYAGGSLTGVGISGIVNVTKKDVKGIEIAGIANLVPATFSGVQISGIANLVKGDAGGIQIAGITNAVKDFEGIQLSGISNYAKSLKGVQIGLINAAKKSSGLQIGLINLADTSSGAGIGLINFVRKGYHNISLSANEVFTANATLSTGTDKLYTMILMSADFRKNSKLFGAGLGLGHRFLFNKHFVLNAELTSQYLYFGNIDKRSYLSKLKLPLNYQINKYIGFFAGPALNAYHTSNEPAAEGYKQSIPASGYKTFNYNKSVTGWLGWEVGVRVF